MDIRSIERLELNKILASCAEYACLEKTKQLLYQFKPLTNVAEARKLLDITEECDKLLFRYGIGKIEYYPDLGDSLTRASKGSTLSCAELIDVNCLLRSSRIAHTSIIKVDDDSIVQTKLFANKLYFDKFLEEDIENKILSSEQVSDYASDKLYSIRSRIKNLNERIRSTLSEYVSGSQSQYLQDNIVTMRNDRYVIPVKAEHKSHIRGLVHDRSQTGATFFIEPELVLELNNELISLTIDEKEEVDRILRELSNRVGKLCVELQNNERILAEIESFYARAEYGYAHHSVRPEVNKIGHLKIIKGRHPLIDETKVVPVSLELGKDYNFLLISGANTGGKTVTLKMVGLFCLMAACGIFLPACLGTQVCIFEDVFCDVGDSQSIEESLSTFSSHITKVIDICNNVNANSLVLIDELGGGTNPDEGQALAKAVVEYLLNLGCKGIVTTHFTPLKEFAYTVDGIENASMEFDSSTLRPLYSIKIGLPGASNALAISRRLGLNESILDKALSYLSEGSRNFENIVSRAEDSRIEAEQKLQQVEQMKLEWQQKVAEANRQIEKLEKERERLYTTARAESRRIISERTQQAEEILEEIEGIFQQEEISETDLIRARTLKNKLKNSAYDDEDHQEKLHDHAPITKFNCKVGLNVYVQSMQTEGIITSYNPQKGEVEVACGSIKMHRPLSDLLLIAQTKKVEPTKNRVRVVRSVKPSAPLLEINVIGKTVEEALIEVDDFIDHAVMDNLEEIKVIHGMGTGKLRNAIGQHLKRHKNVLSYRLGKYGEGETGVTIITLK